MRHFLAAGLAVGLVWHAGVAGAQEPRAQEPGGSPIIVPEGPAAQPHVHNAGERDPTCRRWSDGCVACSRDGGCANIGIACQPQPEIMCLERVPAVDPKSDTGRPQR